MARRVTAVSLACLLAATPPLRLDAAQAAAGCAGPAARPVGHAMKGPAMPDRAGEGPGAAARTRGRAAGAVVPVPGPRSPRPEDVGKVMAELVRRLDGVTPPAGFTVPTHVHVLAKGVRQVSDEAVRTQIDVLNFAYAGGYGGVDTGVRFRLDGITVRQSPTWFADPIGHEQAMKNTLHRGGSSTLNLYIAQLSELMLGFASYPYWYEQAPRLDGVVIDWRSLPGGAMSDYNRGFTGVHEIGHWLGLFHTFENGCERPGDGIEDTPAESKPTDTCSQEKDTCTRPGLDPVHNFMDYGKDRCMSEFTAGQAARMHQMWAAYRHPASV
ncbi:zinc metalloprotease [Nonomuraea sp. NPDC002799]